MDAGAGTRSHGGGRFVKRAAPALILGLSAACHVAGPGGPAPLPRSEPMIRVAIVPRADGVSVASEERFDILGADGNVLARAGALETWRFEAVGGGRITATGPRGRRVAEQQPPLTVRPAGDAGVSVDEASYRGSVLIRIASDGGLTVVNTLSLESYLLGVVPLELGVRPESEIEAVKAQAVAARTYAVRNRGARNDLGFDFYATDADQVYGGRGEEDAVVRRAVEATRGEVVVYGGEPIMAFYHSTCGGRTANVEEVWGGEPVPYLQSVSDAKPGGGDYCDISNRYHWTESWTRDELLEDLGRGLAALAGRRAGSPEEVRRLEIRERTSSGRVATLRVVTDDGTYDVHGDSTRRVLRPAPDRILNSARFELDGRVQDGQVVALTVEGGGWGHGVGMCQMGAVGRARAGQSYRDILRHYYRGTDIIRLY